MLELKAEGLDLCDGLHAVDVVGLKAGIHKQQLAIVDATAVS